MKTVFFTAEDYQTPLCQTLEVCSEGLLCESSGDESYNATLGVYSESTESYW